MLSRIGFFASLPLLVFAGTASAGNARLDALFNNQATGPVSNLCYVRHYDKAHLTAHPKQNVTDMLIYFAKKNGDEKGSYYYSFDAQVSFRDSKKSFAFGGDCNRNADKPGMSVSCGIDCDGGGVDADARDDTSIKLDIGENGVRLGDPEDDKPLGTKGFDTDDRTFVLQESELKNCLSVIYDDDVNAAVKKGTVTQ